METDNVISFFFLNSDWLTKRKPAALCFLKRFPYQYATKDIYTLPFT